MVLTDQEYFLLCMLIEMNRSDENKADTLNEVINQQLQVELINWKAWNEIDAYCFQDKLGEKVIVYVYTGGDPLASYPSIFSSEQKTLQEAADFLQQICKEHRCVVSGYSLGGAYAIYAAASIGSISGVVFNAPGIGNVLTFEQRHSLQVKNYVSRASLIAALGEHPEEVYFARDQDELDKDLVKQLEKAISSESNLNGAFLFDQDGRLLTGEQGELFTLLSTINRTIEARTHVFDEVVQVFTDAVDLDEELSEDLSYTIFLMSQQFKMKQLQPTLQSIVIRFERSLHELYLELKKSMNSHFQRADLAELGQHVESFTENCTQQFGQLFEEYYHAVEAIIAILVLSSPEHEDHSSEIQKILEQLIDSFHQKVEQFSTKIVVDLETEMEALLQRLFL